jgi:tripartite-type tricarboxylate transporter receptor subunit TctC
MTRPIVTAPGAATQIGTAMKKTFRCLFALLAIGPLLAWSSAANAQAEYPNRPIRVVLPFPAGGPGDNTFRILGREMSPRLAQPMFFENHVGGTGIVGQDLAARSPPDGYTLVALTISGALAYQGVGRSIDYTRDFAMIGQIYSQYGLLVVNPEVPEMAAIHSLRDLIAYAKANPGKINYASQGTGSVGHLVMEDIKALTGIDIVHVPYRGVAPAYNDLLAGQIQMMSSSLGALPYIRAGKLRAIAIGSPQRLAVLPDVPTFIEQGLPGFIAGSWVGVAAPPGTPAKIVNRLSAELQAALNKPEVAALIRNLGTEPDYMAPAEFAARANRDVARWGKIMRDNNIKPE